MKRKVSILLLAILAGLTSRGQTETETFKPNGKPVALAFIHFNTSFSDGETRPEFGITRGYLGYEYNFSEEWSAKIILDVGDPKTGEYKNTAFLKNAFAQYNKNKFTVIFGMIPTTQFKLSEKIWGLRYIEKSFQDAYRFNASADLGFTIEYKFAGFISADFGLFNGEGYKNIQKDSILRPGLGITVIPVKNLTIRIYADYMGKDVKQSSLATFAAYTGKKLMLAAEYNYQKNFAMKEGQDIYGTSVFGTFNLSKKAMVFGRFDDLRSKPLEGKDEPWQLSKDGQLLMAGVDITFIKGIRISPNVRYWKPADNNIPATTFAYLNAELRF